ncbi:DUF608 domain-containing protein, variant 2 [Balamuthia mandrillaris]
MWQQNNTASEGLKRARMEASLWAMFCADALSMPVHWYYDTKALQRDYGWITDYQAPKPTHPTSIMHLSNTSSAGRLPGGREGRTSSPSSNSKNKNQTNNKNDEDDDKEVIGRVILHDKKRYWTCGQKNIHYHHGMRPGENTLNLLVLRVLLRSVVERGSYDADAFLQRYVEFMTTPGSHNDTFAEGFHRDFFANYDKGVPLQQCAGKEGHDTASIGGLVMIPAMVMLYHGDGVEVATDKALQHLRLTHRSQKLEGHVRIFVKLFYQLLTLSPSASSSSSLQAIMEEAILALNNLKHSSSSLLHSLRRRQSKEGRKKDAKEEEEEEEEMEDDDVEMVAKLGMACYIESSLSVVLHLAYKYALFGVSRGEGEGARGLAGALIANTNAGGENCHRGAVLGAVMGAALAHFPSSILEEEATQKEKRKEKRAKEIIPKRWLDGLVATEELAKEIRSFVDVALGSFSSL